VRADAGEYVSRRSSHGRFGVILADLYDTKARGPVLDDVPFYRDCRAALAPAGILVVNVFGNGRSYANSLRNVRMAFDDRVIALPPVAAGNVALLAFSGPELRVEWGVLRERARRLEKKDRLPAGRWVEAIEKQRSGGTALVV
jgi:spermidine synthase